MKISEVIIISLFMSMQSILLAQATDMGEILPAQTRCGSISDAAQTDCFKFNGEAGQTVVINMTRKSGSLNPEISLYAPDRTLEISAWGGTDAEISIYQLPQSGTYTIVVGDYTGNSTGDYSLSFTKITQP